MGAGTISKRTVFGARVENEEGTAVTIGTNQLIPVLNGVAAGADQDSQERDLMRGTLSVQEDISGLKGGAVAPVCELAGPNVTWNPAAATPTVSPWDVLMRGAGMKRRLTESFQYSFRIAIGSTWNTGTVVRDGTILTFGTTSTGATVRVLGDYYEGDSVLFFEHVAGASVAGDVKLTASGVDIPLVNAGNVWDQSITYSPADCQVSGIAITGASGGGYVVGDEILGGTSGARGYVTDWDLASGAGTLYYIPFEDSGSFQNAETITVVGGSGTGTAASSPTQRDMPSLSLSTFDTQETKVKGARGSLSMQFDNGDRGLLQFTFDGVGVKPVDLNIPSWPTSDPDAKPPKFVGSRVELRKRDGTGSTYLPKFKSMSIAMDNDLARVDFPGDSTEAGYLSTKITNRRVTGTMDPRAFKEAVFPLLGDAWDKNPARLLMQIGAGNGDGNSFEIQAPMVLFQSPGKEADSGITRVSVPFACRAPGQANELYIHQW